MSFLQEYGTDVFHTDVMKKHLSKDDFERFIDILQSNGKLDMATADAIANAMKEWAIERGATHFTHCFYPMTGCSACKYDAFLHEKSDGNVILSFTGKQLISGESDASSFPHGGVRDTFEARGYTVWDPHSFVFVKDDFLYIPTAFCAYSGEALDLKTPLLRSIEAIGSRASRMYSLFHKEGCISIHPTVGAEQEFFLFEETIFKKRRDLRLTGRTLFGAPPCKEQDSEGHYMALLRPRIHAFLKETNETLWRLGIPAQTIHNEAAPSQHEIAPMYSYCNLAFDQNHIMMEYMKQIARKHHLVCIFHEKPFQGVNGSGKHNNWSLATSDGKNLFSLQGDPVDKCIFYVFIAAMVLAVDLHGDILRLSCATYENDLRLGGHEAPVPIVSLYLGNSLWSDMQTICEDVEPVIGAEPDFKPGVRGLPTFGMDNEDRNRTAPIAFTGNKFEFRMVGASQSIADINIAINTAMAHALDILIPVAEGAATPQEAMRNVLQYVCSQHGKIVFNGNSYATEWLEEAEERGLDIRAVSADCFSILLDENNKQLFAKYGIYNESELLSRYHILHELYYRSAKKEAKTMGNIVSKDILPACYTFLAQLSSIPCEQTVCLSHPKCDAWEDTFLTVAQTTNALKQTNDLFMTQIAECESLTSNEEKTMFCIETLLPSMKEIRQLCDKLECILPRNLWPFPTYDDLLFWETPSPMA